VSLSGSVGLQALTLAALGSGGTGVAALAASIDWSLWDGGQRRALVAQQDALLEAKQISYEAAVRSAFKDVEDALVTLRSHHERASALSQAAQSADGVLQLSQLQRQAGLLSLADVLSAQRSALSADLSLQSARTERTLALIALFKALGGGWQTQAAAAAPTLPASAGAH
jgi:multidrug efflux system outer membrane protein